MNGEGTLQWNDEKEHIYIGQFKNDKIDGKGTLRWKNGQFEGEWRDGKQHG